MCIYTNPLPQIVVFLSLFIEFLTSKSTEPDGMTHKNAVFHLGLPCADPESFVRGGPTLTTFFFYFFLLVDEGRSKYHY